MKKVLLLAAAALFSFTVSAQTEQGGILVGGASSLGFSSHTTTSEYDGEELDGEVKTTGFGFMPTAGFFVADGIAAGLMIDINNSKQTLVPDEGDELESSTTTTSFGPFVRYYVGESGLFGQGYVTFGGSSSTDQYFDFVTGEIEEDESEASVFGWGIAVGYALWVADQIAIDVMLGYGGMNMTQEVENFEGDKVDAIDSTNGINFSVGVTGVLGN